MIKTVFDDNDLKRLKDHEGYWRDDYDMRKLNPQISASWGWVDGLKIDALLARLAAAELCADHGKLLSAYLSKKNPDAFEQGAIEVWNRRYEAWRKAADK